MSSTRLAPALPTLVAFAAACTGPPEPAEDPLVVIEAVYHQSLVEGREAAVLEDLREVQRAQDTYRLTNRYYDELSCLVQPRLCRPYDPPGTNAFLDSSVATSGSAGGFRRHLHAGPQPDPDDPRRVGASRSSIETFAFTVTPETSEVGPRAFCADDTGRICYQDAGKPLAVVGGRCAPCEEIPAQGLEGIWRRERPSLTEAQRSAVLEVLQSDDRIADWSLARKDSVERALNRFAASAAEASRGDDEVCEAGDVATCLALGRRWLREGDRERAAGYYQRACDGGSEDGCFGVASYLTWKVRSSPLPTSEDVRRAVSAVEAIHLQDRHNAESRAYLLALYGHLATEAVDPAERERAGERIVNLELMSEWGSSADHHGPFRDRFVEPSLPAPEPPPPPDTPIQAGAAVREPTKIRHVDPVYPEPARRAGVQGVVILEILIDVEGRVASARVLRSIPALDQAALDAVRRWAYEPPRLDGVPVPATLMVTVSFPPRR